ncbi:alpha/beta-hydrolase [Gonapodya prolifera JEL478]|uniref:triacylglycerol lipase n=1 Tax=Gonapodya prolifera (strain JEL478) TaxID=1344416 RepID=A0A139AF27_GONPJ|nr:alpha/beta-hydrolase [Gonapodya prolifera JEL478]|eukprot:KXS15387.1 alpha/beta-hydrolase [Gonapodya prolifera JEL478]
MLRHHTDSSPWTERAGDTRLPQDNDTIETTPLLDSDSPSGLAQPRRTSSRFSTSVLQLAAGLIAVCLVVAGVVLGWRSAGWRDVQVAVAVDGAVGRGEQATTPPATASPISLLRLSRILHLSPPSTSNAFKQLRLPLPADTLLAQSTSGAKGHSYFHPVSLKHQTYMAPPLGTGAGAGAGEVEELTLEERPVPVPQMEDPMTVLSLAYMAWNTYTEPNTGDWVDVPGWNETAGFGWSEEGIRGYVFEAHDPSSPSSSPPLVAVVIKGTSLNTLGLGGPTSPSDKLNDNMMFSCCCGKEDRSWWAVCPCYAGKTQGKMSCDGECIRESCGPAFPDSYYNLATEIVRYVRRTYPTSTIWAVGHSLGGALATSVGLRFRIPAVSFEAPGEALWASRVGALPRGAPGPDAASRLAFHESLPIFHVGNDGDPIFLGKCRGARSSCYYVGYAIETRCHNGKWCIYETDKLSQPPPEDDEPQPEPEPSPVPAPGDGGGGGGGGWCWHGFGWCKDKSNGTDTPTDPGTEPPSPSPAPSPAPAPPSSGDDTPEPPGDPWCFFWCSKSTSTSSALAKRDLEAQGVLGLYATTTSHDYFARREALYNAVRESARAAVESSGDIEGSLENFPSPQESGQVGATSTLSVNHHRIAWFVQNVLLKWSLPVPACVPQDGGECEDCAWWDFV